MIGTEKQINWAKEIKADLLVELNELEDSLKYTQKVITDDSLPQLRRNFIMKVR